jgi:hypothetical protein
LKPDEYSIIDGGNAAHFGVLAAAAITTRVVTVKSLLILMLVYENRDFRMFVLVAMSTNC